MDVIVYSSNYCPLGSYEHHSIEDHFEKWQGYETGIILKSIYQFENICLSIFWDNKDTVHTPSTRYHWMNVIVCIFLFLLCIFWLILIRSVQHWKVVFWGMVADHYFRRVYSRVGKEYKNLWQTLADMIFPCLNFPSSAI